MSAENLPLSTMMFLINLGLLLAMFPPGAASSKIQPNISPFVINKQLTLIHLPREQLGQGSSLVCETCISPGESCTGLAHPCRSSEDTCLTIIGLNTLAGGDTTETLKTCIAAEDCYAGSISITTNAGLHFQSISRCCQDDLCNREELKLPSLNVTSNGLQCPVCSVFGSDHCEGSEMLSCTGADSHCITVSGMLNAGGLPSSFTARGCSTKTACSLPLGTALYSAGVLFNLDKVICTQATEASRG